MAVRSPSCLIKTRSILLLNRGYKIPNELLLIISLAASYCLMLVAYKLFGKKGLFVWIPICTILANIEVSGLVNAFGLEQTLGNTLFASSYLATDILSERHGKKDVSRAVWAGIFTTVCFIFFSFMWQLYTASENDWAFEHIHALFSNTGFNYRCLLFDLCIHKFA